MSDEREVSETREEKIARLRAKHTGFFHQSLVYDPRDGDLFDVNDLAERARRWSSYSVDEKSSLLDNLDSRLGTEPELGGWVLAMRKALLDNAVRFHNWQGIIDRVLRETTFQDGIPLELIGEFFDAAFVGAIPATHYVSAYSRESRRFGVDVQFQDIDETLRHEADGSPDVFGVWKNERERFREYRRILAESALSLLAAVFIATSEDDVTTALLNINLTRLNPATGHDQTYCLVSVQVGRDQLEAINLERVDPVACLKSLRAVVASVDGDIEAVRPIAEVRSLDPRFVDAEDVLSSLDSRSNLMLLTPGEFESLIQNLFQAMGLDTNQTQASRDGGVDAVAYDPRPVLGGKVVIQAKDIKTR